MRLIETTHNTDATATSHARWSTRVHESAGSDNIRNIATMWVRGSNARAIYWNAAGRRESGKNVPEKSDIGVMNRNDG
jgi:hypothetical protein